MGYRALHYWVARHKGKASYCEFDPSHQSSRFHWSNISGKYLRDLSDYQQLCASCHKKYDLAKRPLGGYTCRKGHAYTPENTRIKSNGWRICKTCQREYVNRFLNKKMETI